MGSGNDEEPGALKKLTGGIASRTFATAKLGMKVGMKYAARTIAGEKKADDPKTVAAAIKSAENIVQELGRLKGLAMKGGQMISYLHGAMPPEAQRILAKLQAESTPMEFTAVEQVIREELGGGADDLFTAFERRPFAAASIGQVHRAEHEGRAVAVKIQYPGIEKVLESELGAASVFARLGTLGTALDGAEIVREIRERTREECDYENEAKNQKLFRRILGNDRRCIVPEVIDARSTRRVLTTALTPGRSFQQLVDGGTRREKDLAGELIFGACFGSIFRHCVYNGDPHPGNYLFPEEGRVVFLDYGCVRHFDAAFVERWKTHARAVVRDDRAAWQDAFMAFGMVAKPHKFDWDYQWEVTRYLYTPFIEKRFTYDGDYVSKSYKLMIFDNPNKNLTACPAEWVLLNRLQWGLNSVLAHLHATADWRALWADYIDETRPAPATLGACGGGAA